MSKFVWLPDVYDAPMIALFEAKATKKYIARRIGVDIKLISRRLAELGYDNNTREDRAQAQD